MGMIIIGKPPVLIPIHVVGDPIKAVVEARGAVPDEPSAFALFKGLCGDPSSMIADKDGTAENQSIGDVGELAVFAWVCLEEEHVSIDGNGDALFMEILEFLWQRGIPVEPYPDECDNGVGVDVHVFR